MVRCQKMNGIKYSWILPIKNEAASLPKLFDEIKNVMGKKDFEVISIDDCSKDNSLTTLKSLTLQIPQLRIIHFKTPGGKWAALEAGFKQALGQIIITLDSDLQDDPKEVRKLLAKLNQGYDLVSGARIARHDPSYKVLISKLGNSLASFLSGRHFWDINSPFKVYKRQVLDNLPKQGSMLRFTMLFAMKLGYKVAEVPINHRPRIYGKSKFGIIKYLRIIYDLILVLLLFSGSGRINRINKKIS